MTWWRVKWVVLWSLWVARVVRQPTLPVRVSNGLLRGSIANNGFYRQYMGIPYATVINRFQAPGPEPTWDGVFEADREHIRCIQLQQSNTVGNISVSATGREDCLTLNIYTPLNTPTELLPVMVFIHGGGFLEGSSSKGLYGPEYLTRKGVILVTINYRLGVEGFLCLGIKEAPGNAAMKDQVAALKWVRRNIKKFGGDPDNVTLFGESAGGASVSFHLLSPMSKGLVHKTIQQSGSSLASWTVQLDYIQAALFKAKAVGYTGISEDPKDLYNFFQSKPASEIITHLTERTEGNIIQSRMLFMPCIEKHINDVDPFLTEPPHTLLSEGRYNKIPVIIGSNSEEGFLFLSMEVNDYIPKISIEVAMPKNLAFPNPDVKRKVASDVQKMYIGDAKISTYNVVPLSKFYGEPFFNFPAIREAELIAKTNTQPVYSYYFKYDGWRNIMKLLMTRGALRGQSGAVHADELFYMFSHDLLPALFEYRMIKAMSTMWTNFAKFGDPTPKVSELLPLRWPALKAEDQRSLVIDQEFSTGPMWYNDSTLSYWKHVYAKYRRNQ